MKKQIRLIVMVLLALCWAAGSCEGLSIKGHTVGLVKFIRPEVTVDFKGEKASIFEDTRFLPGTEISISEGARSTLYFDSGVRVVADSRTRLLAGSIDDITLQGGRILVDADEKEQMTVHAGQGRLAVTGSEVSLQLGEDGKIAAYTTSGELTYSFPGGSGVARAGESLTVRGGSIEIRPEEIWSDWTGGLAEAGPRAMESPVSIGQIYARLPGALGQARWPLIIRRHEVRVTIEGDLAVTETMQEFFNPASDTMEGIYRLSIPADAMLQRFAVDRGGKLVDGVIMERATAKQEYTSHVYQGSTSDPALLEWVAPGSFRARIYPIKPGQVRTVAFRYSQWLKPSGKEGDLRTYVYPVGNETIAPQIGEFYFVADVSGAGTEIIQAGAGARVEKGKVIFAQSDFRPRSDFFIQFMDVRRSVGKDEVLMVKTDYKDVLEKLKGGPPENYAYTQFLLRGGEIDLQPRKNLRISVTIDTSAATGQYLVDLAMTFLESLFEQLRGGDQVAVFAGDVDAMILGQKDARLQDFTPKVREAVMDAAGRHPVGGATDIGRLIMDAAAVTSKEPGGVVVYIGDGFPTVGELDLGGLKEKLGRLPNPVRMYGIALGEESNLDLLTGLTAGRGFAGRIESGADAAAASLDLLADASTPVVEDITYVIDGDIERIYPSEVAALKITDPVRLIGKLSGKKEPGKLVVKGSAGGKPFTKEYKIKVREIDDYGDLKLRWAEKRLMKLMDEQEGPEAVIELGTRYGIITPYTSFYVPPEEEAINLPESPPFEIFKAIEGTQASCGPACDQGEGETTIAQAIIGIFLPYGCCFGRSKSPAPEQASTAEEKPPAVMEPPAKQEESAALGQEQGEGEAARATKKADAMYGIKGPADNADLHKAEGEAKKGAKEKGGLALFDSPEAAQKAAEPAPPSEPSAEAQDVIVNGKLGTAGHGAGGGSGVGYGRGPASLEGKGGGAAPSVKTGAAVVSGALSKEVIRRVIRQHLSELRYCYEQQLTAQPDLAGQMSVQFVIAPSGNVQTAKTSASTLGSAQVESCVAKAFKRWSFPAPAGGAAVAVNYPLWFSPSSEAATASVPEAGGEGGASMKAGATAAELSALLGKQGVQSYTKTKIYFETETYVSSQEPVNLSESVKRCQEASLMPVEEKAALWKERLGSSPSIGRVMQVFGEAKKSCEIKTAGDRRAFARVVLGLLGGVGSRCQFYQHMKPYPALADYIKAKILASLGTPEAVKTAMEQCDSAVFLSGSQVDAMLDKIKDMDGKIVALKKLINLYPEDLELKLKLLDLLEDAGRKDEAVRFAGALRADPYATDEVRTRVGEFFIRAGDREEGRRVLSEMVEFAPWSYGARRRLGDLYRTYGWYEDAYRQYETLAQMAPDDDVALILLAEAAILAGRTDEGLRVLQQVSQSEPSFEGKISPAEIARVISSLTLAQMRVKARGGGDAKQLKEVMDRTKKSGVLRDASYLKIVLKWDHPDAMFDVALKFPGSELGRPMKSAPSVGMLWLSEKGKPSGDILVQVERLAGSVIKESKATLTILIDEGKDSETLIAVPVAITAKDKKKKAWTISPVGKVSEASIDKTTPL